MPEETKTHFHGVGESRSPEAPAHVALGLLRSLSKNCWTCMLLASAWALGPQSSSQRVGSLSGTCWYSRDPASPQEDHTQEQRQEASLGEALLFVHPIPGEAQGGDQDIGVATGVHFLHIHAKDQLQILGGLAEDVREGVLLILGDQLQHLYLRGRLLGAVLEEQEGHQLDLLPAQRILERGPGIPCGLVPTAAGAMGMGLTLQWDWHGLG